MTQTFIDQFMEALTKGDLDSVELLFMEELESPDKDIQRLLEAADQLLAVGETDKTAELLGLLLEGLQDSGQPALLDLLKRLCLCDPGNRKFRKQYVQAFKALYAEDEVCLAYLKALDLPGQTAVKKAFLDLDNLLRMKEGDYVLHPGGWGVGKVTKVSTLTGKMTVDLEQKSGHQVTFAAAASIFIPLAAGHFSARLYDRRDALRQFCQDSPLEMVRLLLTSFGSPQTSTDIRERLLPDILEKAKWAGWWQKAKNAIKKDAYVRFIGGARPTVELLDKPMSEVDDLVSQFKDAPLKEKFAILKQLKNHMGQEDRENILTVIKAFEDQSEQKLAPLAMYCRLGEKEPREITEYLGASPNGPALLNELKVAEAMREIVSLLGDALDFDRFLPYFLNARSETLNRTAEILLKKDPQRFITVLRTVFENMRLHVWPFFWLYGMIGDPKKKDLYQHFPTHEVLFRMLSLLDFLFRSSNQHDYKSEINAGRNLFSRKKLDIFQQILDNAPDETLKEIFKQVLANRTLKDDIKGIMREKIGVRSPEAVKQTTQEESVGGFDTDVIYVTEKGFRQRQQVYDKLVNQDIQAAIEEVGRAQEFGDLSENAEWTAALEKRDKLGDRAKEMKEEMQKVRFITPDLYHEGHVSLGAEVTVEDQNTRQTHTWSVLGPWDGDQESGVLNYLSPLGRGLLGHQVDETVNVDLPEEKLSYKIIAVQRCSLEIQ